ncbi:M28 family peptidase [Bacillus carboniphilus]|uniref:M28 family peptidase n=1 Tax=Bacillus carboniphilus TaxID=86663 RepID=A0ABY9JUE2_9BACI|nr:M28 family peptidase [Bacillus carboniphilus]WLR43000.1 M28 family peptidase [Bacillus carboniphilus]
MKKKVSSLVLTGVLLIGGFGSLSAEASPVSLQQRLDFKTDVVEHINVDRIYDHIAHLSQTPRVAGSEEEHQAAEYIAEQYESYGYEANLEPFQFSAYESPESLSLTVNGKEYEPSIFTYSPSGQINGEVVFAGLGKKEETEGLDLTGKIALIQRGELYFSDKVKNAAEAGAIGVIIFNNVDGGISGTLGSPSDDFVPAVSLTKQAGEEILQLLDQETVIADLSIIGGGVKEKTSYNVEAVKSVTNPTLDTGETVIVGSHYDSVEGAPGANDDASGTAATLELAKLFSTLPTDTELRFVTFGAEELGLIGSYEYVDNMTEEEIDQTVAMFQMDMIGSRDAGDLVMNTADGLPSVVTDLGSTASALLSNFENIVPFAQSGRSDHVPFSEVGIASANFIHSPLEPWYHSPDDTLDKISKAKLKEVSNIVGASVYQFARLDTSAFELKEQPNSSFAAKTFVPSPFSKKVTVKEHSHEDQHLK